MNLPGRFVTLEGLDGSGKSTQLARAAEHLRQRGFSVTATREPGGTELGQRVREVVLHHAGEALSPHAELALMFAARAQHIAQVILPALRDGRVVLCDRFTDSSIAYQGYGRGVALDTIRTLEKLLCGAARPDLTVLFDIDARTSAERTGRRNEEMGQPHTRFEEEGLEFFERVRQGYLAIAREEPQRVKVIDASQPLEQVWEAVRRELDEFLNVPAVS